MLPEADVARVRAWADEQVPPEQRDKARVEVDQTPRGLTIHLCEPPWDESFGPEWMRVPVARLSWVSAQGVWRLYWARAGGRFEAYPDVDPTPDVDELLAAIDEDDYGAFWG